MLFSVMLQIVPATSRSYLFLSLAYRAKRQKKSRKKSRCMNTRVLPAGAADGVLPSPAHTYDNVKHFTLQESETLLFNTAKHKLERVFPFYLHTALLGILGKEMACL